MKTRTLISFGMLVVLVCLLAGFSLADSNLWENHFSHWSVLPSFALLITLLMGLVLMDDLFELDGSAEITFEKLGLKVEIKKFLVCAFLVICTVSIIFELVQFFLSQGNASLMDPMIVIGGSVVGIAVHIIGSKLLMKRVEFELERWEDNVL
ncbi:MAG: hypothetical protein JRE65_17005 [Deltaproteobacteria bacterium]|jgi:hypothetical protein|nr:hypothetical protein [Deltaproteobacteria bacterium]